MDMPVNAVWTNTIRPGAASAATDLSTTPLRECIRHVIDLLDAAVRELSENEPNTRSTLLRAASLLRLQFDPSFRQEGSDGRGRLLAWQARKVRDYIDSHIAGSVLLADLGALVRLSEGHFARHFRRSFGQSPHAFVIRRRLEVAARHMLETEASLSDIALQCGFADQAHLCKHFRRATGHTPSAWRRTHQTPELVNRVMPVSKI
jgi:AraC family transcriptional regulator